MVGNHISMYSKIQSVYLNITYGAWFTICWWFSDFPKSFSSKLLKVLLFPIIVVYLCFAVVLTVVTLVGYIINLIPIVNWLIEGVIILIWNFLIVPLAMLATSYNSSAYTIELERFDKSHII